MDRREFLEKLTGAAFSSCVPGLEPSKAARAAVTETGSADSDAPAVFWKSGAGPGQLAMLAGHGLDRAAMYVALIADTRADEAAPARTMPALHWQLAKIEKKSGTYAYVEIPEAWPAGMYAVRLGDNLFLRVNAPEVWWMLGDGGDTASPGGELKLFGQFLQSKHAKTRMRLRGAHGEIRSLQATAETPYALTVTLPRDLQAGVHEVQVHNGSGGDAGWSESFQVAIADRGEWPADVFRVTDFGAKGNSDHDDTDAFRAALAAAERNRGGVVCVPKGIYRITGQLTMPQRVTLRGADRENVWLMVPKDNPEFHTVIGGAGHFAIEDLSIVAQTTLRIITAPDVPSQYKSYLPWGDTGAATASDVHLRRLRIHHLRYAHRLAEGGKDPRRLEDAGPSTIALAGPRLTIEDCDVVSPGMPIILHRMSYSRVVRNEFRIGRNGWYGFWGARDALVEGNVFEGQDLEASYGSFANYGDGSGPDVARLYIAHNQYLNSFGDEREAITFDSSGHYPWKGKIDAAEERSIRIPIDADAPDSWNGLGCLITGGRGMGQLRKVESVTDRNVTLDTPWVVRPDQTSTVAFMPFKRDVVIYQNESQDASVGVQLWGGGYNFIIDGNKTKRSGGFWGSAAEYTDKQAKPPTQYFLPLYFTQWLRNEIDDGFIYQQGPEATNGAVCGLYIRDVPSAEDGGILTFANLIRDNRLYNRAKIVLRFYDVPLSEEQARRLRAMRKRPWSLATIIEGNSISDSATGIEIEPGFEGVTLRRNEFARVGVEIKRAPFRDLAAKGNSPN